MIESYPPEKQINQRDLLNAKHDIETKSTATTKTETQETVDSKRVSLPQYMQAEVRALEGLSYYHGMMSRDETEKMMKRPGDFLLRATDNRTGDFEFIVSFYNNRRLHSHFTILSDCEKQVWWLMIDKKQEFVFPTVQALVEHYARNDIGEGFKFLRGIPKGHHLIAHNRIAYNVKTDLLGTGNFSEVYRGRLALDSMAVQVALKNSKMLDDKCDPSKNKEANKAKREMIREAYTMSQLRHANTTQLFGIAIDRLPVLIVVEFCQGGCLLNHLIKMNTRIGYPERLLYISDMLNGLAYIHGMSVIHRDLACRNALIAANGFVKLADFGLGSKARRSDKEFVKRDGEHCPARWMAPESLMKKKHSFNRQTDVYALGVTIWEMYSNGVKPYQDLDNEAATNAVRSGKSLELPKGAGVFIESLYGKMTAADPNVRITSDMAHQTFQEYVRRDNLLSLDNLTLNDIGGVKRVHIYHYDAYIPQVVVLDGNGNSLGYQDAPSEMLVKTSRK